MSSPIEKRKEQLKKYIEAREKEHFVRIVRDWKHFWMNQKQNSEEDYQNYFNRAFGIDANMTYHLADKLVEDDKSAQITRDLLDALEALEKVNEHMKIYESEVTYISTLALKLSPTGKILWRVGNEKALPMLQEAQIEKDTAKKLGLWCSCFEVLKLRVSMASNQARAEMGQATKG